MRQILPLQLWIGNAADARNIRALMEQGIKVVVDLAMDEPPAVLPREVTYCRIPLIDGAGNAPPQLRAAISVVSGFLKAGSRMLVACSGGISRSPSIVAAAISVNGLESPSQALAHVAGTGPCDVMPELWNEIVSLCGESKESNASRSGILNLLVVRSKELNRCLEFYQTLGLTFVQEQHGSGPVHWTAATGPVIFEVYPMDSESEPDRKTRLGFQLADLRHTVEQLRARGFRISAEARQSPWGLRAVAIDPDERSVELIEPQ